MKLVEVKRNRFVIYTDDGKVVIQTSESRIAKGILNGSINSNSDRPTEDTT